MTDSSTPNQSNYEQYAQYMPDYAYVNPYYNRVGFGKRFLAYFIDNFIIALLVMLYMILSGTLTEIMSMATSNTVEILDLFEHAAKIELPGTIIGLIYFSTELFFAFSFGKLTLGIRIGSENAENAQFSSLAIRYIVKNISNVVSIAAAITGFFLFGILGSLLGFIVIIGCFFVLGQKRQAFQDMLAKTAVYLQEDIKQN
ncbi:MAG: RDD family protein [Desulfobulbaceae bacterium]|nr:RDD family protein [Candidatus Kapabacteria bacterium]MBS4001439.1 RDD family protein [Desulfobulbaceae bacterium]